MTGLAFAGAIGIAYLLGGLPGAVVATVAAMVGARSPRMVALGAMCALAGAALATVLESPLEISTVPTFGVDRDLAAALGRYAGVMTVVAIVAMASRERAFRPSGPSRRRGRTSDRWGRVSGVAPWTVALVAIVPAVMLWHVGDANYSGAALPVLAGGTLLVGLSFAARRVRRM